MDINIDSVIGLAQMTFEALLKGAERILVETGQVLPHFVVQHADGRLVVIPLEAAQMGNETYKDRACEALREILREFPEIVVYGFITEAWEAEGDSERPPSQREDRREIVLVMMETRDGQGFCSSREIDRDAEGKPVALVGERLTSGMETDSRFSGLFQNSPMN